VCCKRVMRGVYSVDIGWAILSDLSAGDCVVVCKCMLIVVVVIVIVVCMVVGVVSGYFGVQVCASCVPNLIISFSYKEGDTLDSLLDFGGVVDVAVEESRQSTGDEATGPQVPAEREGPALRGVRPSRVCGVEPPWQGVEVSSKTVIGLIARVIRLTADLESMRIGTEQRGAKRENCVKNYTLFTYPPGHFWRSLYRTRRCSGHLRVGRPASSGQHVTSGRQFRGGSTFSAAISWASPTRLCK